MVQTGKLTAGQRRVARISGMTAKEKLLARVMKLTEAEADETLRLLEQASGNDDVWGDLDTLTDAANRDAMRMLDEEEAAIGFSWQKHR